MPYGRRHFHARESEAHAWHCRKYRAYTEFAPFAVLMPIRAMMAVTLVTCLSLRRCRWLIIDVGDRFGTHTQRAAGLRATQRPPSLCGGDRPLSVTLGEIWNQIRGITHEISPSALIFGVKINRHGAMLGLICVLLAEFGL